jgi:hypothetical protein
VHGGHRDSLRPASDAEPCIDVVEVFPHRPGRDEETGSDFAVRHPRRNEAKNVALARAEGCGRGEGLVRSVGEAATSLPDEREVRREKVEHSAVAIAECPPLAVQDEVTGAGFPDGEKDLHHVVDPEWSADLGMEVEPAELAEAENVREAARPADGSDTPSYPLWPRRKWILLAYVLVQRPQRTDVGPVRSVHDVPVSECGIPLVGGGDRTRDKASQRRKVRDGVG